MVRFKIKKKFVDSDRKEYNPGDIILLENEMKIHRMITYGIIGWRKRPGRKRIIERAVAV